MKTASAWFFTLLVASLPFAASAQIMIATPPAASWGSIVSTDSTYDNASFSWGQTFVIPDSTHTRLDNVELRAGSWAPFPPADFTIYVAQWNAGTQKAVGAPLWTSLQSAAGLATSSSGGNLLSFDTGGINLTAGQAYLLLAVAAPKVYGDPNRFTDIGMTFSNTYAAGGAILFYTHVATPLSYANLSTASIANYGASGYDLAFGATFSEPSLSAVPESSTIAAAFGIAFVTGLFVLRRRQQRSLTASP